MWLACWLRPAHAERPATIDDARTFERGGRDYRSAAAIYAKLCAEGRGMREACDALIEAIEDGRGVARDRRRIERLHAALCRRGDAMACLARDFAQLERTRGPPIPEGMQDRIARVREACDRGDARACLLAAQSATPDGCFPDPAVLTKRRADYGAACRAGVTDGCLWLTRDLAYCRLYSRRGCEAETVAQWRASGHDADRLDALARLDDACSAGEPRACKRLASRRPSAADACAARDYAACSELGCAGDAAADKLARAHGVQLVCPTP